MPTDAYELETAVTDEFLVPPRAEIVDLRLPREGIDYDDLSDEEKVEWENTDWGTGVATGASPSRVDAAAAELAAELEARKQILKQNDEKRKLERMQIEEDAAARKEPGWRAKAAGVKGGRDITGCCDIGASGNSGG